MEEHVCDVQHSVHRLLGVRRVLAAVGHVFIQRHLPADRGILQLQKHTDDTDADEEDEAAAGRERAVRDKHEEYERFNHKCRISCKRCRFGRSVSHTHCVAVL